MKRYVGILTWAATAAVGLGGLGASVRGEFVNPVVASGADPWAFTWGGQYFYMGTTGGDVRIARSPWLESLSSNTVITWKPPTGTMHSNNLWAPELHRLNDKWYIYVAADGGADADHRMYVLEGDSQDPQGTYTFKGQITVPSYVNRWAIDGTVLTLGNNNYFVWSGRQFDDGNGHDKPGFGDQSLYIARMDTPWSLTGSVTRISNPDQPWERNGHPVNEGPEVLVHGDDVFLTYSGSGFYSKYAIGALKLTGSDPLDAASWTKLPGPLFQGSSNVNDKAFAPGHASFVKSPDGKQDWIVYHARDTEANGSRNVRIQQFSWGNDGVPVFGIPTPRGQVMPSPSGVPTVTFIPNLSFERGGTGWLDNFHVSGDVGAVTNDGVAFGKIANADGLKVGYLGANVAGKIWQDIGPLTRTAYTLSLGLALSDDQAALAAAHPGEFIIRLIGTGLFPGGSANDGALTILGERTVSSTELAVGSFNYFDLTVSGIGQDQIGNWLRVEVATPDGLAVGSSSWQVKVDLMTLSLPAGSLLLVPEPAALGLLSGLAGLGLIRPKRGS